jgi:glycosyltransferase involved in cell wall biosynthesis
MFDSFAAGIPIIQNTNGWIKNLVMQSNCGLNVLSNNPKEMAKAITFLTKNNDKRNEMALKSKELAISHFSRNKLAELYIQKLIEIVSIK